PGHAEAAWTERGGSVDQNVAVVLHGLAVDAEVGGLDGDVKTGVGVDDSGLPAELVVEGPGIVQRRLDVAAVVGFDALNGHASLGVLAGHVVAPSLPVG